MAKRTVAKKTGAKKAPARKASVKKTSAKKTTVKKTAARKRAVSKTAGRLTAAGPPRHDLLFEELRDRVLIELAALAECDRAGDRPYKMVLVVKRGKTTPLTYKLVVERAG